MASLASIPVGAGAIGSVSSHPVPAILIGAGLTWVLMERMHLTSAGWVRRARDTVSGLGEGFGETFMDAASATRRAIRDAAGSVGNSVGAAAVSVRDSLSGVGESVQTGATATRRGTTAAIRSTRGALAGAWREHPLAVCAAVLAAGMGAGMLLPLTNVENRAFGETASRLTKRVRRGGKHMLRKGKQLATAAAGVASREVERQGLAPDELGRKVKRVVTRARDAATGGES